jgi:ribose 5-phosphate isomerase B
MLSGNALNGKRIVVAADHLGYDLKSHILKMLESRGFKVEDYGTDTPDRCHYPEYAYPAAKEVGEGKAFRGILICGSGVGMGVVANKVKGVRAAVCHHPDVAVLCREHNDANVLCIPARYVTVAQAMKMVEDFLSTPFTEDDQNAYWIRREMTRKIEEETTC